MIQFSIYNKDSRCFLNTVDAKIDCKGRLYLDNPTEDLVRYEVVEHTGLFYTKDARPIKDKDLVFTYSDVPGNEDRLLLGVVKYYDGAWHIENDVVRESIPLFDEISHICYLGSTLTNPNIIEDIMGNVEILKTLCDVALVPDYYINKFIGQQYIEVADNSILIER